MKEYINFEIKLMYRSKRIKQVFVTAVYFILFFYLELFTGSKFFVDYFIGKIIYIPLIIALPGITLAQYFFGIESNFICKLMTIPVSHNAILIRKYYLYCLMSFCVFILLIPSLFFGIKMIELISSFMMAIGPFLFLGFVTSLFNTEKYDLNAGIFVNWQGNSIKQYLIMLILFAFVFVVLYSLTFLFSEKEILLCMAIFGLIFIASCKIWILHIAEYYDKSIQNNIENIL
ncbi:MAG: DUF5687 family protein [Dysgonamonadaceae bacterium]|jgi:hypothetical protein|nr:DUF5687 family protein [Dysgonamonadaceae bacterium]